MRIARQSEAYGLEPTHRTADVPDPESFAELLGGPRIAAGLLRIEDDK